MVGPRWSAKRSCLADGGFGGTIKGSSGDVERDEVKPEAYDIRPQV